MSFFDTFSKRATKDSKDLSDDTLTDDEITETSYITLKEKKKIESISKEGFLKYKGNTSSVQLTEHRLIIKSTIKGKPKSSQKLEINIELTSIFSIRVEGAMVILFFYEKKKGTKFVLKLDAEEKKQANEWLFSLQRNVFGLTKELSKRRILFFINPYAGIKKAQEDFDTFAKPILDVAHITYETYVSKSKGDITEKMKKMNISDFDEFCGFSNSQFNSKLLGVMEQFMKLFKD
jgi:hypothetical protein